MQPEYKIIHEDGFIKVIQRFAVETKRIITEDELEEIENIYDEM